MNRAPVKRTPIWAAIVAAVALSLTLAATPGAASAEGETDVGPGETVEGAIDPKPLPGEQTSTVTPSAEGPPAPPLRVPDEDRSWSYSTDYLFPLTRHLGEAGAPGWMRIAASPVTAGIDLVQLPFGLIGGLFGD